MHKLCFYVLQSNVEDVKEAIFAAGAGRVGDYDSCSWQVLGQGQFRPLVGSATFSGQEGAVETVVEDRVELGWADECIRAAVSAMAEEHDYETPA